MMMTASIYLLFLVILIPGVVSLHIFHSDDNALHGLGRASLRVPFTSSELASSNLSPQDSALALFDDEGWAMEKKEMD